MIVACPSFMFIHDLTLFIFFPVHTWPMDDKSDQTREYCKIEINSIPKKKKKCRKDVFVRLLIYNI
jgi:hypothetical protein